MAETITTSTTSVPASAKKPQDRKPKTDKDGNRTVTVHGVDLTVSGNALDDFELLDDLNALDEGKGGKLPSVLRRLIGQEKYAEAMDALRDPETGRVSVEAGGKFVNDVIAAVAPNS